VKNNLFLCIEEVKKDKWGRCKNTIWRIYGKDRCIKEWGDRLPSPTEIQDYKHDWAKKAIDARQMFKCSKEANTTTVSKWLKNYGVNKLDYDNVFKDTIIVRDPQTFIMLKLHFSERKG
jgi:hypothetical protein